MVYSPLLGVKGYLDDLKANWTTIMASERMKRIQRISWGRIDRMNPTIIMIRTKTTNQTDPLK